MSLHDEIIEQPKSLERLLLNQRQNILDIARVIQKHDIHFVFVAARGTSDNAARYANYLWGAANSLPLALATPSLFTYYQQPPRLKDALVVGISQSGQSPDIIGVVEEGRRQGNLTLAITNDPGSPLGLAADYVLDIQAGPELAVAATKTYTAELMAIAMLSAALKNAADAWEEIQRVPGWVEDALRLEALVQDSVQRYRYMLQCVVLGRGYNYASAFEWAHKLKELTYIKAEPFSSADFLHGPIAMVGQGFPILAVVPSGKVFKPMMETLQHLGQDLSAELVLITNASEGLVKGQVCMSIPAEVPEWLSPIVGIVPAQLFTYHLTRAKGFDTENPRAIHKITETH